LALFIVAGQILDGEEPHQDGYLRNALPSWIKLGGEIRARAEANNVFEPNLDGNLYLNRLRLNVAVEPARWIRFFIQGQDARVVTMGTGADRSEFRNTLDLHQAYVDFGRTEAGWQLRFGRQELTSGDERLVAADSYWDWSGQTFDALRIGYIGKRFRVDTFAGLRVQSSRRRLDPFDTANQISGLTLQFTTRGKDVLEPYFLWRRGGDTMDPLDRQGHRDVLTPGLRAQGAFPRSIDYNVEMALQRGHVVADRISAWAGHWELGWKPRGSEFGLRLACEYNYASGDKDPADGKYGTFDDLYPAGFNRFGMADLIAWRNVRYPAIGVEMPVSKRWTINGGYRWFWLASVRDGLYPGGDEHLVHNLLATSSRVGNQALASAN